MRLDKELQADVIRELEWEPKVDSANIGVAVDKGAVTLTGHVNTYAQLIAAEGAALRVYGVLAVANELVVKLAGDRTRDDTDIALAISNQMAWNAAIPHQAVKAKVTHGWVTLEGQVDWAYQTEAANRLARGLIGVKGVTNHVIVKPAPQTPLCSPAATVYRQTETVPFGAAGRVPGSPEPLLLNGSK